MSTAAVVTNYWKRVRKQKKESDYLGYMMQRKWKCKVANDVILGVETIIAQKDIYDIIFGLERITWCTIGFSSEKWGGTKDIFHWVFNVTLSLDSLAFKIFRCDFIRLGYLIWKKKGKVPMKLY